MKAASTGMKAVSTKMKTVRTRIYSLLAIVIIPLFCLIFALLILLASFNAEYASALQNANIAAEFNNKFKYTLDLAMWYHVVKAKSEDELPWNEVRQAEELLLKLQGTTTNSDNQWRVKSMLNMCSNLSKYMLDIANTDAYDDRMQKLEKDIYTVTDLIQQYMHDYIYDEVKDLSKLQSQIRLKVVSAVIATLVISAALIGIMLALSLALVNRITRPLGFLVEKTKAFGAGNFFVSPVETHSIEIKALDDGFNDMAKRINTLIAGQKAQQESLHRAELELLQAQINPHFLYNTIDSIVWLAETDDNKGVIKMATSLSVFFRNSLAGGKDIIPISDERDHVRSYLEIQKTRYSDILTFNIDIPQNLLSYFIPKLTLQPLVENAIYHGTKNKRAVGEVKISGYEENGDIFLSVWDNGIGMTPDQLSALRSGLYTDKHTGLGLINVHKRLKLYCGEAYGLSFDSVFGEWTRVTVRLPQNIKPKSQIIQQDIQKA
jgi:two-component system sensor histidine kinase YesM